MNQNITPTYQGLYNGPDGKELTVSLRTKPCRFNCLMCAYRSQNQDFKISDKDIIQQIYDVIERYKDRLHEVELFSFGNDGSLLDEKTLTFSTLVKITEYVGKLFPKLSLETRIDFITQKKIDELKSVLGNVPFEFAVGFETSDDYIRQKVLKKALSKKLFEEKIKLLADNNIFIKIYTLLKPSPYMTEEEGIEDSVITLKYLDKLAKKYNTTFIIDISPVYVVKDTKFSTIAKEANYTSPKLWSLAQMLYLIKELPFTIHLGLSTENNNLDSFPCNCGKCDAKFREEINKFNKHHNIKLLLSNLPNCSCKPEFVTFF